VDNHFLESNEITELNQNSIDPRNKLNNLSGKEWIQLSKSFWYQKGLGNSNEYTEIEKLHPAPFSYQDIIKLINLFTKPEMVVLDPFCGVASTLKAAGFSGRNAIGIEISSKWAKLGKERLEKEIPDSLRDKVKLKIIRDDCLKRLPKIKSDSIDFIVTSPPYWGILNKNPDYKQRQRVDKGLSTKYSKSDNDLGNVKDYETFLFKINDMSSECYRILKNGKYFALIVGDFYHKSKFYPFHIDTINLFQNQGFTLRGVTILAQNNKMLFPYGYPHAFIQNIHHQYIEIFQKID
jgi:DNA modification methylase